MIDPLRITVDLACDVEHAFDTWTGRFGTWWPPGHTVSGDPDAQVFLEPAVRGRIYERTSGGTEIDWGEITGFDRPRRLAYEWHIRRDRSEATHVEVNFVPVGDGSTRVDIVHTGWERLGDEGGPWRDANAAGWGGLLPHFTRACLERAAIKEVEV